MSDLRGKSAPARIRSGSGGKIVAAVAVILALGGLAAYGFETGQFHVPPKPAKPIVTNQQLPTLPGG